MNPPIQNQERRSSVRSSMSEDSENYVNDGRPRIRDLRKKVKLPCFGYVYKRQLIVHAISILLIVAYIVLICLV